MSSGGSKDEFVSCTVHDPNRKYIIVGGNTTSDDYAPAANDHGFVYAVDYEGNWRWGNFFYNESYAISTVSGCKFNDDGNLVVMGLANQNPVVLEIETKEGSVLSFVSLAKLDASATQVPRFYTFGGFHHDVKDEYDDQSYIYMSFIMDDYLMFAKVLK